ncbi:MORN repeat-containing protein 5 [Rhizophlyctis rosea]|nr:MORN repeat-containing protein 5 [Rhizophlyctis rosea]
MAFAGSPFEAESKNGRIEGKGKYTFPNGNVYIGELKDGQFHGDGTIHFTNGGKYEARWENGLAVQGLYTFKDGLEYAPSQWDYCTELDRRFYTERVNGFRPGEPQLSNDPSGPPTIPIGTYDVGDGYFNPDDGIVYTYTGQMLRQPGDEEKQWILGFCRIGEVVLTDPGDWTDESADEHSK